LIHILAYILTSNCHIILSTRREHLKN